MKNLFLSGIAALFLATGTVHAADQKWEADTERRCYVRATFEHDAKDMRNVSGIMFGDNDQVWVGENGKEVTVDLRLDDILELQKHVRALKKCEAFWQCLADREAGKVKHCYVNDRRWR